MDFHNPKVETRMVEHLRFADRMVTTALGSNIKKGKAGELQFALRQQMTLVILNYTLGMDFKLKNTLSELPEQKLPPGQILEDLIL